MEYSFSGLHEDMRWTIEDYFKEFSQDDDRLPFYKDEKLNLHLGSHVQLIMPYFAGQLKVFTHHDNLSNWLIYVSNDHARKVSDLSVDIYHKKLNTNVSNVNVYMNGSGSRRFFNMGDASGVSHGDGVAIHACGQGYDRRIDLHGNGDQRYIFQSGKGWHRSAILSGDGSDWYIDQDGKGTHRTSIMQGDGSSRIIMQNGHGNHRGVGLYGNGDFCYLYGYNASRYELDGKGVGRYILHKDREISK